MGLFDASQIVNLVGQLGGDHQQASKLLGGALGQGGQVDTQQHGELLQQLGLSPQQLHEGGYQEHLDGQNHPDFQGYDQGEGGYEQDEGAYQQDQGSYQQDQGGYQQGEGQDDYQQDQGGYEQDQDAYQQGQGGYGQGEGGYEQDQRF